MIVGCHFVHRREFFLMCARIDVRVEMIGEDPESWRHPQIHTGRLHVGFLERLDLDAPFLQSFFDRTVRKDQRFSPQAKRVDPLGVVQAWRFPDKFANPVPNSRSSARPLSPKGPPPPPPFQEIGRAPPPPGRPAFDMSMTSLLTGKPCAVRTTSQPGPGGVRLFQCASLKRQIQLLPGSFFAKPTNVGKF